MENKLDQFFKNKLKEHTLAPSAEAWTKMEATLTKKNNTAVWQIAAAILITGSLISVIIWSQQGGDKTQQGNLASQSLKKKQSSPASVENKSAEKPSHKTNKNQSVNPATRKKEKAQPAEVKSLQTDNKSDINKNQGVKKLPEETQSIVTQTAINTEKKNINENEYATLATASASTRQKPIKLEFVLEDFSSEQPVATVNEEKSTRLKKVWELAREVKNGEGPVREMKNELFAFGFRKSKNQ